MNHMIANMLDDSLTSTKALMRVDEGNNDHWQETEVGPEAPAGARRLTSGQVTITFLPNGSTTISWPDLDNEVREFILPAGTTYGAVVGLARTLDRL